MVVGMGDTVVNIAASRNTKLIGCVNQQYMTVVEEQLNHSRIVFVDVGIL